VVRADVLFEAFEDASRLLTLSPTHPGGRNSVGEAEGRNSVRVVTDWGHGASMGRNSFAFTDGESGVPSEGASGLKGMTPWRATPLPPSVFSPSEVHPPDPRTQVHLPYGRRS